MIRKFKLFLLLAFILGQFFAGASAQEAQCPAQAQPQYTCDEIIFSQKIYPISAIDPTILTNTTASFYPGLRGANQLIIYTPAYGFRTNTNEFGTEAIVNGNIVTSISGADSIIPRDGLVISGHGYAKKWMNENIILGSKIYVNKDSKTLTVYNTSESFLYGANEKIKEVHEIIRYYRERSYMYDAQKPYFYIDKAKDYLEKARKDPKNVQKYASQAIEAANFALASSIPYEKNELKGIWIRPTEKTEEAISATLDRLKNAGIDSIFLETYFHGETIFPSKTMENYQFKSQNEDFIGFDPLKIWIEEAHNRNIKVHIWFETFYVGNDSPKDCSKSILAVKPEWGNKTKRDFDSLTAVPSLSEHGGYFIDPANPDAQAFLESLITEIIRTYHPDGINLDYIRYPQSISAKFAGYELSNWGYTEYARNEFKALYGKDPIDICYCDDLWSAWDKYRQDKITSFVSRISKLTKQNNTMLTAVIFPDRQKALEVKQQDWRTWSALNYVDGFTPLLLTCDPETARAMMKDVDKNKSRSTKLYAGLFITFMDGASDDLLRQIQEARKMDAKGVIIFDYAHLKNKYVNMLTMSAFKPEESIFDTNAKTSSKTKREHRFFRRNCDE